jgi:hypothetical protein
MPVIARFYGILIKMYFKEHGLPHFHALYAEFNGVFDIESLEMIEWKTQEFKKLPGLE